MLMGMPEIGAAHQGECAGKVKGIAPSQEGVFVIG
jgi:hypothetical protein